MRPLVFVDTETTGLDPRCHEVYEVALTKVEDDVAFMGGVAESETKDLWIEPRQLQNAESGALQVGRYYKRRDEINKRQGTIVNNEALRVEAAIEIARFTEGCHLVGANPGFDAGFMSAFLRDNGACPAWHHRLIDVEALAIGVLVGGYETWGRPQSLSDICEALEIKRDGHTARGDCDAAASAYLKLMKMAEQRLRLWEKA